jgi:bifunctional non-homologous end joining protein LigD
LLGDVPRSFDDPRWRIEIKFDGYRALALIVGGCVRLASRNGYDLIGWFPTLSSLGKRTQRIASTSTSTKYDSLPRPATNTSVQGGNRDRKAVDARAPTLRRPRCEPD